MSVHSIPTSQMKKALWLFCEHYDERDRATFNRVIYLWWRCSPRYCRTTTSNLMVTITYRLEAWLWVPYANIFMNNFEERHVYTHHLQPLAWYRYIDDIFCLWQHGEDELEKFTTHLNSVHETSETCRPIGQSTSEEDLHDHYLQPSIRLFKDTGHKDVGSTRSFE